MFKNNEVVNIAQKYRAITVTPISATDNGNGSFKHYELELRREAQGYNACWTDGPENHSRVGDLFAFIKGAGRAKSTDCMVEVREIVAIPSIQSDVTRMSWVEGTNSYKHTNGMRNFLVLGPKLGNLDWESFCEAVKWRPYHNKVNPNNAQDHYRTPVQRTQSIKIKA